jgi:hypothetical protein
MVSFIGKRPFPGSNHNIPKFTEGHNGRLLNECADMLATRGVHNEPRPCPVSTIRVSGEDSDCTEYVLLDGEETPVVGKEGEGYPLGRTYVLKASSEERPFSVGPSSTQGPTENVEQTIEENLRETLDLSTRDALESVQVQSPEVPEEDESFPIPEESNESSSPQWETGEAASMKICRMMKFLMERVEWETRPKPEWWSPAWDELAEARNADGSWIPTGSPKEFKEGITDEVFALDDSTLELRTDESTGERIDASIDPELINVAAAVVWNPRGATMVRKCDRGQDINDLVL